MNASHPSTLGGPLNSKDMFPYGGPNSDDHSRHLAHDATNHTKGRLQSGPYPPGHPGPSGWGPWNAPPGYEGRSHMVNDQMTHSRGFASQEFHPHHGPGYSSSM